MGRKRIPQRTCVSCRQVRGKREMIRIVRDSDGGIQIDETGKKAGRGAYLCRSAACWRNALERGSLSRALKTTFTSEQRAMLCDVIGTLPEALIVEEDGEHDQADGEG
mgnify:CR=1 FL=1